VLLFTHAAAGGARHPYVKRWKHQTFGKRAVAGVVARTGVAQLAGSRHGGKGASGFGKRLGAGLASHTAGKTVEHAVAARLYEDLDYHRSNKRGFGPRLRHALVSTVVTRNTRTGKRTPAAGKISGHAAAGAVSQGLLTGVSGASTAGVGLAAEAGTNFAREFWPRHNRRKPRAQ
jgi:hypothetical protein